MASPGVVTHGVTLFFLQRKLTTIFSHRPQKLTFVTNGHYSHPLSHLPIDRFSGTFVKFSRIILLSLRCHPLDGVTLGGLRLLPPSDATA